MEDGTASDPASGAALALDGNGAPVVDACTFVKNSMASMGNGAGLWIGRWVHPTVTRSRFSGNRASNGGAVQVSLVMDTQPCNQVPF